MSFESGADAPRGSQVALASGGTGFGLVALGSVDLLVTDTGIASGLGIPLLAVQFLGYASFPVGTITIGFANPLLYLSMVLALAGFVLWAVWLATFLRSDAPAAGVTTA